MEESGESLHRLSVLAMAASSRARGPSVGEGAAVVVAERHEGEDRAEEQRLHSLKAIMQGGVDPPVVPARAGASPKESPDNSARRVVHCRTLPAAEQSPGCSVAGRESSTDVPTPVDEEEVVVVTSETPILGPSTFVAHLLAGGGGADTMPPPLRLAESGVTTATSGGGGGGGGGAAAAAGATPPTGTPPATSPREDVRGLVETPDRAPSPLHDVCEQGEDAVGGTPFHHRLDSEWTIASSSPASLAEQQERSDLTRNRYIFDLDLSRVRQIQRLRLKAQEEELHRRRGRSTKGEKHHHAPPPPSWEKDSSPPAEDLPPGWRDTFLG